jgi:mono/diheme cytochrome c family protein
VLAALATVAIVAAACGDRGFDPDPDVVARGEQLYATSCVQCHGGPTGGQISDIPPRHNAQGHTWHHADCLLTEIVLDVLPPRPGATGQEGMPALRGELSEPEVEAILTYLRTWWTDEQRQAQAEVTAAECAGE